MNAMLPPDLMRVSACPSPFSQQRIDHTIPVGLTLAEIVELVHVDPMVREHGVVFLNDDIVPREYWRRVKPKQSAIVSIRIAPRGGGALRLVASIAVVALAITATVITGGLATPLVGALVGAGISIGGTMLINMLLPPPTPKMAKNYGNESPTYSITGARNAMRPWEKLPFICGNFRIVPPYAAMPYREVIGGDVYWRALFAIGHGPLAFGFLSIGQTEIANFQGVEIEYRRGYWSLNQIGSWNAASGAFPSIASFGDTWTVSNSGTVGGNQYSAGQTITFNGLDNANSIYAWDVDQGKPFALFPSDVYEDALSAAVKYGQPPVRTSQVNADEIAIELVFERGLVHIQNSPPGKRSDRQMTVAIQQAPTGTGNWANVITTTITGRQTSPLYWGHRWNTSSFGAQSAAKQYDIRVFNLSGDQDEDRNFGNFTWFSLKTFTLVTPVPVPAVAMIALRVKASGQLSGTLDEFNLTAQSICRDWDGLGNRWVWRPTQQPAALYRHLLQHPSRRVPATDDQIDLDKLAYWDSITRPANRVFNGVYDSKGSLYESLSEICRMGRATPTLRELKYSVIIDEPKTAPVRMFTPANSWDYQGEMNHGDVPNAYRVGYVDKDKDWTAQEVIVYDDGYDAGNAVTIDLVQWVGADNRDQAWKEGRYHLAQQRLRREVHKISTDFEHLCCERGDLVALQYDTISVGSGTARVLSTVESGATVSAIDLDSSVLMEAGKSYSIRARRVVGNEQRTDTYDVATVAGEQTRLTLLGSPLIFDSPRPGDLIAFGERSRETIRVLVRDIEPKPDLSAVLTLIAEAPGVHTAEFGPIPPYDAGVTFPQRLPAPVVLNIASDARVMIVTASRSLIERVVFALQPISIEGAYIRILYRLQGTEGSWQAATVHEQTESSVAIIGPQSGEAYDFRLQYLSANLMGSPVTAVNSYYVVGRTGPPDDLHNLSIAVVSGQALLRWDLPADVDVQVGGWIMFRHSPLIENALWPNTTTIAQAIVGDQTHAFLPLKQGTYFGRVFDADGRQSANAIGVSTKHASVLDFSPVNEVIEDPTFVGPKSACFLREGGLVLNAGDFDSIPNVDLASSWDVAGGIVAAGLYKFASGIDFGSVRRMRIRSHLKSEALNEFDYWDSRTGNIDEWEDVDGTLHATVDAQVYGKFTDDDPASLNPVWGDFVRIDSLEATNRALGHLECRMFSQDDTFNIWVTELRVLADEFVVNVDTSTIVIDGGAPGD